MITIEAARSKALERVAAIAVELQRELVLDEATIEETSRAWIFHWTTKKHHETGNWTDGIVGNGPILVDKSTGELFLVPTGGHHTWLQHYERTGLPPDRPEKMRAVSDLSQLAPEALEELERLIRKIDEDETL